MGTDKIKVRHLDEDFKLPLDKLENMPSATDIGARPSTWVPTASEVGAYSKSEIDSMMENVSPEITINGKSADENGAIELNASDVGARPNTWTPTASDVGAVPTTRKVNGKALSSDVTLSASDVGATTATYVNNSCSAVEAKIPVITYGTEDLVAGESALETGKLYFVYEVTAQIITFKITIDDDILYQAERGMTFAEWVDSEYSRQYSNYAFYVSDDLIYVSELGEDTVDDIGWLENDSNHDMTRPSDVIVSNGGYYVML